MERLIEDKADRRLSSWLLAVIPATLFLRIDFGGELFLPELLLIGLLPFLLLSTNRKHLGKLWPILLLGLLWLFGQMVTDVVRDTPFSDYSRGWAKIVFTLANCAAIHLLVADSNRRLLSFGWGYGVGAALLYAFNPSALAVSYPWKFGMAFPVTLCLVLVACSRWANALRILPSVLVGSIGILNLLLGFRSLAGVCLVAALYLFAQQVIPPLRAPLSVVSLILIASLGGLGIWASLTAYSVAATNGWMGETAEELFRRQSRGSLGVVIGGRSEILVSSQAIADSPVLGHGSWARDGSYRRALNARLIHLGYSPSLRESELIPTHSFLLGAWVEAGILGAVFWIAILRLPSQALLNLYRRKRNLSPLVVFASLSLIWDIFFSPLGSQGRILFAFYLAVLLHFLNSSTTSSDASTRASGDPAAEGST